MEAALIWPILFFAVFFVLSMCLVLYAQTAVSAASHRAQREAAGLWSETVYCNSVQEQDGSAETLARTAFQRQISECGGVVFSEPCMVSFRFLPVYSELTISQRSDYLGGTLVHAGRQKLQESTSDIVNEAQLIRNYDYAVELLEKKRSTCN